MSLEKVTEAGHGPEHLKSWSNGTLSFEEVTIDASQTLKANQVLGQKTTGSATVTAGAVVSGTGGTPGNGSIGTVTADDLAQEGDYEQVFIEPASNLGTFEILRPDGTLDGTGVVGTAYNGMLNFTQADGSADFVAGDRRTINVAYAAGNGRWVMHDPEATNGAQVAAGILWRPVTTGVGETAQAVITRRNAEIFSDRLEWDDQSDPEKLAALAELAALGIIAR